MKSRKIGLFAAISFALSAYSTGVVAGDSLEDHLESTIGVVDDDDLLGGRGRHMVGDIVDMAEDLPVAGRLFDGDLEDVLDDGELPILGEVLDMDDVPIVGNVLDGDNLPIIGRLLGGR